MSGKRNATVKTAEQLGDALGLRGRSRREFIALAQLESAKTEEQKWNLQSELFRLREKQAEESLEIRQFRMIARWHYSALWVLCGLKNIDQSVENLSQKLGKKVGPEEIQRALDDLVELGLLEVKGDRYQPSKSAVSTGSDTSQAAVYEYHRTMLEKAREALGKSSQQREFEGLTVAIPKSKKAVVKQKIRDFLTDLNLYLSEFDEAEDVYQIGLQMFELTEKELK